MAAHRVMPLFVHAVVELYFGISRCAQPLPRGCTGHVANPFRSIAGSLLHTRLPSMREASA
jgi:hypothetical protein